MCVILLLHRAAAANATLECLEALHLPPCAILRPHVNLRRLKTERVFFQREISNVLRERLKKFVLTVV